MPEVDMKQKIKEVRDKFLSNNQIEDIRQNITLGVEERLKYLNSEQTKVVELLEEKHKELDFALKTQSKKIEEDNKSVEIVLESKITDLSTQHLDQSLKLKNQSEKIIAEQIELEERVDAKFKITVQTQRVQINDDLEKLSAAQTEVKDTIESIERKIFEKVAEGDRKFKALSEKNLLDIEQSQVILLKKLEEMGAKITRSVDEKLETFKDDKEEFLNQINQNFSAIVLGIESKIEAFLHNHETVENIIDSRLKEFRAAQKAAFEELEAALNLLEKHQDETLTRYRQKSDISHLQGQNRPTNLPNSFVKNRGSILYQSESLSAEALPSIEEAIETTTTVTQKSSSRKILKPMIIALMGSLVLMYLISYFNINYDDFINLSRNLIQ